MCTDPMNVGLTWIAKWIVLPCTIFLGCANGQEPPSLERRIAELPGSIIDLDVGGSGRYIVMRFRDARKLHVFDLMTESFSHAIPVVERNVLFAATQDKLIVLSVASHLLQRWDLATGKREIETLSPIQGLPVAIAGSASASKTLVMHRWGAGESTKTQYSLLDAKSLRLTPFHKTQKRQRGTTLPRLRASADGTTFAGWGDGGLLMFHIHGDSISRESRETFVSHACPRSDGSLLFSGNGILSRKLEKVPYRDINWCVPAVTGPLFVSASRDRLQVQTTERVLAEVNRSALLSEEFLAFPAKPTNGLQPDQRVLLSPSFNRLLLLPEFPHNALEIYHLPDDIAAPENTPLEIATTPPLDAIRGATLRYSIRTSGGDGKVTFRLITGPSNMSVSNDGIVLWRVPKNHARLVEPVKVEIKSDGGKVLQHGFVLRIANQHSPHPRTPARDRRLGH